MQYIQSRTFDEIQIGDSADLVRTLSAEDIALFASLSGDVSPPSGGIAHGMWGGALICAVIGTELPGPGAVFHSQSLRYLDPVDVGDTVTIRVSVTAKDAGDQRITLRCQCINNTGQDVIDGEAQVSAPLHTLRRPRANVPDAHQHPRAGHFRNMIAATQPFDPVPTAVVHPCDAASLSGALAGYRQGIIIPILVGPTARIQAAAQDAGLSLDGVQIVDTPHSDAAAAKAVALVREGRAGAIMKGKLHTDELMRPILHAEHGLRTKRRMSHVFAIDVPTYPKLLYITDAAINIYPTLVEKCDITQNAIDLAQALGVPQPKVAILSAVETVYPKIQSTLDAAALCKMADRGQITGGVLDGPLAFDNAISKTAAASKGIVSDVAGAADILVVPDLEAGNMISKQLIYLAGADAAGLVLGARVPIILTSRADGEMARLTSCALAQLFIHRQSGGIA